MIQNELKALELLFILFSSAACAFFVIAINSTWFSKKNEDDLPSIRIIKLTILWGLAVVFVLISFAIIWKIYIQVPSVQKSDNPQQSAEPSKQKAPEVIDSQKITKPQQSGFSEGIKRSKKESMRKSDDRGGETQIFENAGRDIIKGDGNTINN